MWGEKFIYSEPRVVGGRSAWIQLSQANGLVFGSRNDQRRCRWSPSFSKSKGGLVEDHRWTAPHVRPTLSRPCPGLACPYPERRGLRPLTPVGHRLVTSGFIGLNPVSTSDQPRHPRRPATSAFPCEGVHLPRLRQVLPMWQRQRQRSSREGLTNAFVAVNLRKRANRRVAAGRLIVVGHSVAGGPDRTCPELLRPSPSLFRMGQPLGRRRRLAPGTLTPLDGQFQSVHGPLFETGILGRQVWKSGFVYERRFAPPFTHGPTCPSRHG